MITVLAIVVGVIVGGYIGHVAPSMFPKYPAGTLVRCSFGPDDEKWDAYYVGRAAFWFHNVEVPRDPSHWWEAARTGAVVPVHGRDMEALS